MRNVVRGVWCVGILALAFFLAPAFMPGTAIIYAQDGTDTVTADEVNEVARELFCPTCESTPLDVCPTQTCEDWRQLIRQQLAEGKSKEEILDYFEANFGPQALAEPPQAGFNLTVWVVPVILIAVGGVFFALYLRRLKMDGSAAAVSTPRPTSPSPAATPLDPYREQIERELQNKD